MSTEAALDAMRAAPSILDGMRAADAVTLAATRDGGPRVVRLLAEVAADPADGLVAVAAVHALAQVFDRSADDALLALLCQDVPFLREHTAWVLGGRLPQLGAVGDLVRLVVDGGFAGMLAQRTLGQWGGSAPEPLVLALEGALLGVAAPAGRDRLVETLGLLPGSISARLLRRTAVDADEATGTRAAAIAALGDRAGNDVHLGVLSTLAQGTDELADVARLALFDLTTQPHVRAPWSTGSTIAQLFLHADIDRELAQVGAGDNGGIATLLVRLGDALVEGSTASGSHPASTARLSNHTAGSTAGDPPASSGSRVERVVTISRGRHEGALAALLDAGSTVPGHVFATVPVVGEPASAADSWPHRVAAERGLRRVLRAAGPVDVLHLRMADVGSLAAATVARERDIPIVFTVAPDPHVAIAAQETAGGLTRASFGVVDAVEHYWFRVRLVQRIAADAAHLVVFPRPDVEHEFRALVGIDLGAQPDRHSVIAEGIDLGVIQRALAAARPAEPARAAQLPDGTPPGALSGTGEPSFPARSTASTPPRARARTAPAVAGLESLDALLRTLPAARRGLPLAITVGRVHEVKGMAALVQAWAGDPTLNARCNLVVVGGDLENPSRHERGQLERIFAAVPRDAALARGLVLAGHRANTTVASWLAAARYGRAGVAAPAGVYVCASVKEEFGIALLEAMATGLAVVAPGTGGPATYVENGVTGFLVDTRDADALSRGMRAALDLAAGPFGAAGARRGQDVVRERFTIQAMAQRLSAVYDDVVRNAPVNLALSAR